MFSNNEQGIRRNDPRHNNPAHPEGNGTFGGSVASGPAPTTAGPHKHDLVNKLDPRVDSTQDKAPIVGNSLGSGPHKSRIANALDPRVDSDNSRAQHRGPAHQPAVMHGGVGGAPEGTYGPHSSRIANALDPRVDSDADGRGAGMPGSTTAGAGYNQGAGYPVGGGVTQGAGYQQGAGLNTQGAGLGHHHAAGTHHRQQPYGATAGRHAVNPASGPGPAPNTAGPHHSDLMNKLDPRVDSKAGTAAGAYGNSGTTGQRF